MDLADLFKPGQPLAHTLGILALLRNTVHSEAIRATLRQHGWKRDAVIRLPEDSEQQILASMEALGGRDSWGCQGALNGLSMFDPGHLVERLFPEVLTLLTEVMEQTSASGVDRLRVHGEGPRWFCERNRLGIRWQLGL